MRHSLLFVPLLLAVSACTPSGTSYHETSAKLVVYRVGHGGLTKPIKLTINHEDVCNLLEGGYYESQKTGPMEGTLRGESGTSHFVPKGKYVRASIASSNLFMDHMFGELSNKNSPVTFENVDVATAKRELAGVKQDCVEGK